MRGLLSGSLVAALALATAGCTSSGKVAGAEQPMSSRSTATHAPTTTRATTPVVDHRPGFTSWVQTFVDTSRRTVPKEGSPRPSRPLITSIYRPNGNGPFPLIVFAHGVAGHPDKFTKLFAVWANAGFAIAAPAFPLTNDRATDPIGNLPDVKEQAPDESFVLDQVLALNAERGSRLFHAIDADRIGAAGLSLGGATTYNFVFSPSQGDARVVAAEVLDGFRPSVPLDGRVPMLIAHSDTDPLIPFATARAAYGAARAPVWFVTLHGASHATQWENDVTPYDHIDEQLTTDFWEATLHDDESAFARLQRDATVAGLSAIEQKR